MILGAALVGLLGLAGAWAVNAVLFRPAPPGESPDANTVVGPGDEGSAARGPDPARRAMREKAAVIGHRFWRKPITADRLNDLLAAIRGHDPKAGRLYIDRDGGMEAVPAGGEPRRLNKPYRAVDYEPDQAHPNQGQATAILRGTLDRAEGEYGAGR